MPWTAQEGPRTAAGPLDVHEGPGGRKTAYFKPYKAEGPLHPPQKSAAAADAKAGFLFFLNGNLNLNF